jgi:hypothetical protein
MSEHFDISVQDFQTKMARDGWYLFNSVLPGHLINQLNLDLEKAYKVCRDLQISNGIDVNTDGTVHHILGIADSFTDLLEFLPLNDFMRSYFQGNYILNSYGGVINTKNNSAYVANVHRDIRSFSAHLPLMMNMLIMLDDFTLQNGATYLLTGSHLQEEKPSDQDFYSRADRTTGRTGSILLFNSNLWHAAGRNETDTQRRALTLTFTKPFMKQQLDYPRAVGYDKAPSLSENLLQLIGYNARIPENLNEWYQPPHKRLYKSGQG